MEDDSERSAGKASRPGVTGSEGLQSEETEVVLKDKVSILELGRSYDSIKFFFFNFGEKLNWKCLMAE